MIPLSSLNKVQKEAVINTDGPIMILAGAGSGKTRTLVSRISYIIEELQVSPYQLLALTFSNKAAKEMRERIADQIAMEAGALQVTTFHAFCARILRNEAVNLGLSRNFTIYDSSESKAIAKKLLSMRGINTKEKSPFEILDFIDEIKNHGAYEGRTTTDYIIDKSDENYQYYVEYENELHKANAVDFGGLITGVIELFEKFPNILQRYQERYKYVLVDEYQDTNRAQFDLVTMLVKKHQNICVVGDEDQSIYSWRGADINNILDFEKVFPKVKLLNLEQNYRSSKNIIEAASYVISRNTMRKGKSMWTDNPEGESLKIIECHSDKQEAEFVAAEAIKLEKNGTRLDEIAVFYRTNAQSRLIEDNLRRFNLPYKVIGGIRFYERKEVKDLLAYIRLIVNSKDSLALTRVINIPARGIGAVTLRKLEQEAIKLETSLWDILSKITASYDEHYRHLKLSAKVKSAFGSFENLISECKIMHDNKVKPSEIYEKILCESGYLELLKSAKDFESVARLENLQELSSAIKQFEQQDPQSGLAGFLETITLDSSSDTSDDTPTTGEISLMTVHGAKGLEFPFVFVVGAEENVFPSFRSLQDGENSLEEERRLFYVAMTRAMKRLYIMFAQGRMLFGQLKFNGPSRFINEIPDKLYIWEKQASCERGQSNFIGSAKDDDFDQSTTDNEKVYYVKREEIRAKFPKGARIIHSLYGEGKVLETEGIDKEEKVLIKFKDGARKKFMVRFAPLTLI